jgi:hypothetical protein
MTGNDAATWQLGKGVVLYGQPGIGMSVLGDYLLHEFLCAGWLVVTAPFSTLKDVYMFKDGVVYHNDTDVSRFIGNIISRMYENHQLGNGKVVIILDSSFIGKLYVPVISVSSPGCMRDRKLKDALNHYAKLLIPMPSIAEMEEMQAVVFNNIPMVDVKRRMSLWGCIPRSVFVLIKGFEQQRMFDELKEITAVEMSAAVRAASTGTSAIRCHRMLQERCLGQDQEAASLEYRYTMDDIEYYSAGLITFVSGAVEAWSVKQPEFTAGNTWDLWTMVVNGAEIADLASLNGYKFEELVWQILRTDRTYTAKQLGSTAPEQACNMCAGNHLIFDSINNLESHAIPTMTSAKSTLLVPKQRHFGDIDGILVSKKLPHFLQITVSTMHELEGPKLLAAARAFGYAGGKTVPWKPAEIRHCFLVPEDKYAAWSKPMNISNTSAGALNGVCKQYAICLPSDAINGVMRALTREADSLFSVFMHRRSAEVSDAVTAVDDIGEAAIRASGHKRHRVISPAKDIDADTASARDMRAKRRFEGLRATALSLPTGSHGAGSDESYRDTA